MDESGHHEELGVPNGLKITAEEIAAKIGEQGAGVYGRYLVAELKATGQTIGECKLYLPNDEGISETDVKLLPHSQKIDAGLTNYTPYTATLNAIVDSIPILTDTVTVMPTDLFVYLPVVLKQ